MHLIFFSSSQHSAIPKMGYKRKLIFALICCVSTVTSVSWGPSWFLMAEIGFYHWKHLCMMSNVFDQAKKRQLGNQFGINKESNLCSPLLYINGQDCFLGTKKYLKGSDLGSPLKIIFFASLRLSVKQEKVRLKFLIWGLTGKVTW
ncbi:uncharacterized protein DS421_9g275100 [Arachis hypogaea]|nr:uncharacterized protein DS421_9g275100 [Arachis hypogaea]